MSEDTKFDGILMTMIQQKGNIDGFFDGVFGFLRRNTDFFADQKRAEEIIVNNCRVNFEKYNSEAKKKQKEEAKKKEEQEKKRKLKEQKERKEREQQENKAKEGEKTPFEEKKEVVVPSAPSGQEKKEEDNEPAPKGNGGKTDKYIWTQTLENVEMFVYLDQNITKKNLKITITMQKLTVIVNGAPLIDGKWKDKINTEETYWTIESGEMEGYVGKYLHLNIQKWKNQNSWWSTPIQGDIEINTQKINPEPSKLSDLDGETRSTVEKMMFDMRQKQQGLPTSDQLQKQDKLKEFMKAHPEMDFSQCKFN